MLFDRIPRFEEDTLSNVGIYSFEPFSIPVGNNEPLTLDGMLARRHVPKTFFLKEKFEKERIYLHFTAGNLQGDLPTLTGGNGRISTAFLIGRNGQLLQLFSSAYWAWHLGRSAIGPFTNSNNRKLSRSSIAIEISNYGPLIRVDDKLFTVKWDQALRKIVPGSEYCTLDQTDAYYKLDEPYRGNTYYCSYTMAQYERLIILLRYLTNQYNIPRSFLEEDKRYTAFREHGAFRGIVSHVNARQDKVDIGPAFNWDFVIQGVQAAVFEPQVVSQGPPLRSRGATEMITNEEAMEAMMLQPENGDSSAEAEPTGEMDHPMTNIYAE